MEYFVRHMENVMEYCTNEYSVLENEGNLHWNTLIKDVRDYVSKCMVCKIGKRRTNQGIPGLLSPRDVPFRPFAMIACDHLGPLDKAVDSDNCYIFIIVDYTTRYHLAYPVPSTAAKHVIECFENQLFPMFGTPD